ncbi:pyridoxamine 5'-phosphate oxidase family protein [Nocardioides sp. GY 10127]|uniref:pyridoxamine 5'-phosphate oxidase family protein n=1 Tax=Nocardioides sp. GY 10127 TaxID=2569762 RepID=UPI0010A7596A|nr:pyridoxamine 5'-phosphate oxidase family protein [Nocardioides sp. GY 10127]TIC85659.1 pyridoxamine 5'-phosphate oxidase family protein [Nocardioides sp. GY 10127]
MSENRTALQIEVEECWDLLASATVARLGWNAPDGPVILPVNIAVEGRTVTLRTSSASAMTRQVDDSPVALEVDDVDGETRTGWSVLVRGVASTTFEGVDAGSSAEPWLDGAKPVTITIRPREVTGRRVVEA